MRTIAFYLTCLLMLLVPMGQLLHPTKWHDMSAESGRGVTTFIAVGLILMSLVSGSLIKALMSTPGYFTMILFVVMSLAAGFLADASLRPEAISLSVQLGAYVLLSLSIVSFDFSRKQMLIVLSVLCLSGTAMCSLALIDYYGIAAVPTMNELYSVIKGEGEKTYIKSLSGPFRSRTEFAAHAAFFFPILLVASLEKSLSAPKRLLAAAGLGVVGIATLVAGSRGLYLGVVGACLYIIIFSGRTRLFSHIIKVGLIAVVGIAAFAWWKPDEFEIIAYRFSTINYEQVTSSEADSARLEALKRTYEDLRRRPFGLGFTKVYVQTHGRDIDAHSIYTEIIRAAGPLGIVFVFIWAIPILKRMLRPADHILELPIFGALICFGIYGMTHSPWSTNILWVLIGFAFSVASAQSAVSRAAAPQRVWVRWPAGLAHSLRYEPRD